MQKQSNDPDLWQSLPAERRRGRAAVSNPKGRFEREQTIMCGDGWTLAEDMLKSIDTHVTVENARSVISRNQSPDIPFDRSINPYRGCEHGCVYCYARPSHAVMGLSPGLDFETKLFAKQNAVERLQQELAKPGYSVQPIAMGTNTDPYQPIEKQWRITRGVLELLAGCGHPVTIVTKSNLIMRDLDILAAMASRGLVKVTLSLTTLDRKLARALEPRAPTPERRLQTMAQLSDAGIPVGVLTAPIIPGLNDHEIEALLTAAHKAGARDAGWVMLRLPYEVKALFAEWLEENYPDRAARVWRLIRSVREGAQNNACFHDRMKGKGVYGQLIAERFAKARDRLGLHDRQTGLNLSIFRPPALDGQLDLFGSSAL